MEGGEARGFPAAITLSNPLIVPVYVRYRCSNTSAAHHLPEGCQLHCSLDMPCIADSRDRFNLSRWESITYSRICGCFRLDLKTATRGSGSDLSTIITVANSLPW